MPFLGDNAIQHLVGPHTLASLTAAQRNTRTGRSFFPRLISGPFRTGLHLAVDFALGMSLIAAWTSWLRGGKYTYVDPTDEQAVEPVMSVAS